jgi:hypothetical protein
MESRNSVIPDNFLSLKTAQDLILRTLFDQARHKINSCSLNKVCSTQTKIQFLFKDQGLDQLGLLAIKLQSCVPELRHHLIAKIWGSKIALYGILGALFD